MKINKRFAAGLTVVGLLTLTGCSGHRIYQQVNAMTFPLEGVSEIIVSYAGETVTFYESDGDALTVKEYISESAPRYCAKVDQSRECIEIRQGAKPWFQDGFSRYIEVYLPASYHGDLTVKTTEGDIDLSGLALSLHTLRIHSDTGAVQLYTVEAHNIHLATGGVVDADGMEADTLRIAAAGAFRAVRKAAR